MSKSAAGGAKMWVQRDTGRGRFLASFNVPGQGEVRVLSSDTVAKAKRAAAGRLRAAIANAGSRNGK